MDELTDAQLDALERKHWKVESNVEYEPGGGFVEALDRHETFQHRAFARAAIAADRQQRPQPTPEALQAAYAAWFKAEQHISPSPAAARTAAAFALAVLRGEVEL